MPNPKDLSVASCNIHKGIGTDRRRDLDRMMLSPHGALLDVESHDSPLARRASDHLPIKARLRLGTIVQ